MQDRYPQASLTLVGGGANAAALRSLAVLLGLHQVTFAGRVDPADIADVYAAHDIYVQSPLIDNMPASVLEAFACGLPVVSTDAGGVPRIVTHDENGMLAPVGPSPGARRSPSAPARRPGRGAQDGVYGACRLRPLSMVVVRSQ